MAFQFLPFFVVAQDFIERDKNASPPASGHSKGVVSLGGVSVNLYSGTASPVYPIYELPSRGITVPVSLNYVAGNGVQVTSMASEVGTGWALNAGGAVTCEVKGHPDELDTEPKAWLNTFFNHLGGDEMGQAQRRLCEGKDTEYDIYHLSAMGVQADFVIYGPYTNGNQAGAEVCVLNDRTLAIEPRYQGGTSTSYGRQIISFLLTDANGMQYTFDQYDRTRVQTETKLLRTGSVSAKDDYTYTSRWFLTRVRNTRGDEVYFTYTPTAASTTQYKSYTHVVLAYTNCGAAGQNCQSVGSVSAYHDNRYETTTTVSDAYPYKIAAIFSAAGQIQFQRNQHNRRDAPGEKALDKISILDPGNNLIKSYTFSYGYFGPAGNPSKEDVRLRLDKITEKSSGCEAASTDLLYHEYGAVSRMGYNRDYWGYFNNNLNQELLPLVESRYAYGNRDASWGNQGENCILYRIQQSTGAYTELTYGHHIDGQGTTVGGVRIQAVRVHNGLDATKDQLFEVNYNVFDPNNAAANNTVSSAPQVKTPQLYDWQNVRYSTGIPNGNNICDTQDDMIEKYLYRSSDPVEPIPADYIHYRWVSIKRPNRSRSVYKFSTAVDFPDTYNGQSVKVSSDPYNLNSQCYTTGGGLPSRHGGSCDGDPLSPPHAGDYLGLPQDQRPYGVLNSAFEKRGLVLQQLDLDSENRTVNVVDNEYDFQQVDSAPLRSVVSAKERQVFAYNLYSYYYNIKVYKHERNWIPLIRQTTTAYDQRRGNGSSILSRQSLTEYFYSNYLLSKVQNRSLNGGDITGVEYRRVRDTNSPVELVNAKSFASLVQKEDYRLNPSTSAKSNSVYTIYEYLPNANNYVLPTREGMWDVSSGVSQWQYKVKSVEFDEHNNIANTQTVDDISSGTLRGHNQLLPIATIANGKFSIQEFAGQIASTAGHTSFEEYGAADGWWPVQEYSQEAKTGNISIKVQKSVGEYPCGRKFRITPENQHGKYIFSCWAKLPLNQTAAAAFTLVTVLQNGSAAQNDLRWTGRDQTISSATEWKRCQVEVNLDDPSIKALIPSGQDAVLMCYVWLTGASPVLLDEIRFHSSEAQMTTVTYRPLVGKTSSTDENEQTTYFTYDAENRPVLVKDDRGNVIKRSKVNFVGGVQNIVTEITKTDGNLYPGYEATFTASAPECTTSAGIAYSWNYGDGSTAKGAAVQSHTYQRTGSYSITVVAEAPGFNPIEQTLIVQVVDPIAVYASYYGTTYYDLCDPAGGDR